MKYTTKWNDLRDLYPSIKDCENDLKRLDELIKPIEKLKGQIKKVDGLYKYIQLCDEGEFPVILEKVASYVERGKDLDGENPEFIKLSEKINNKIEEIEHRLAFFEDEINKIPIENLKDMFKDKKLKPYKYYFEDYFDNKRPRYSKETLNALITAQSTYGQFEETRDLLAYTDVKNSIIKLPDGEKELTDTLYDEIRNGDFNRDVKKDADNLKTLNLKNYINTFTALLYNHMKEIYNEVKLDNKTSVLASSLKSDNIEPAVFDNIIKTTHKLIPYLQKFVSLKKKYMKVPELYYSDIITNTSADNSKMTYEEAVDEVRESLKVLGKEYIDLYNRMVTNGHIDVYPADKKKDGAYCAPLLTPDVDPYVLLNYTGFRNEASTLAHELGHTIYAMLTNKNVKFLPYRNKGIFLDEIASTLNENLFSYYSLNNAKTDKEKLALVEEQIENINATIIRQILYTEFEDWLYKKVENGERFVAEELCDKWVELNKKYYGDDLFLTEGKRYSWADIPHFYYEYYVYKYATSLTYSIIFAKKINSGKDKTAVDKYLNFLKSGETEKSSKILKKAGVDILDIKTYDSLIEHYKNLIKEYETLNESISC